MSTQRKVIIAALGVVSLVVIAWSAFFIYRTSFIADFDGKRYFCLFDDAMISMRYAWNLVQGNGLVWNPGEHVEGYTNLLMTLWMALASLIFDARDAVLAVQISGICFLLAIGFVAMHIARLVTVDEPEPHRSLFGLVCFASAPCFYPLAYWTLLGMETGLATLLIMGALLAAISFDRSRRSGAIYLSAVLMGLAYLARPDSCLAAVAIAVYLSFSVSGRTTLLRSVAVMAPVFAVALALPVAQLIFRVAYYGEIVPNTYTLKISGLPLILRLKSGLGYVVPFLGIIAVTYLIAGFGVVVRFSREKLLMLSIALALVAYQIWAGGDPWDYWRIMTPGVPLMWILFNLEVMRLAKWLTGTEFFKTIFSRGREVSTGYGAIALLSFAAAVNMASLNDRYLVEAISGTPYYVDANERNVNRALAFRALTDEKASMAVIWAGAMGYYGQRHTIDCLGKTDARIAHLQPDVSRKASWNRMESVPGHNKYDLNYSIRYLMPTYVENAAWQNQWESDLVRNEYVGFTWRGANLVLRKESPLVHWEMLPVSKRYQFSDVPKGLLRTDRIGVELGEGWEGPVNGGSTWWVTSPAVLWASVGADVDAWLTFEVEAIEINDVPEKTTPLIIVINGWQRQEITATAGEIARTRIQLLDKLNDLRIELPAAGRISLAKVDLGTQYLRGAVMNLAANRRARQSSTRGQASADRAVDDRIDGVFRNRSVTETERESQPWWEVDLGMSTRIDEIALWNRTDCCGDRLRNFMVFISESPIPAGEVSATKALPGVTGLRFRGSVERDARIQVNRVGRYVRIQLRNENTLSLAEVQVWQKPTPSN